MKKAFALLHTVKKFTVCSALALGVSLSALSQTADIGEANKKVILKYQERINNGDAKGAVEYISDEMMNFGRKAGKKGVELVLNDVFTTFPDWKAETLEIVAVGDAVILRQKITGTHRGMGKYPVNGGMLVGVQPTGKRFEATHMHWYTLRDGKIVGHYGNRDDLGMMQQLGLVPASLTAHDSTAVK
jgi:predicted ester cyclase